MKKKVLVIAHFCDYGEEKTNNRFNYIANLLSNAGYDVELITSDFSHRNKKKRIQNYKNDNYQTTLVHEPIYKKNISIRRVFSHYIMSKNLSRYLKTIEDPKIIYCGIPSLNLAATIEKYAKQKKIKMILDVQDIWPEAFKSLCKNEKIFSALFYFMERKADKIYKNADKIISVSYTYLNRALKNRKSYDGVCIYLGTDLKEFDKYKLINNKNIEEKIKLAYIGTLGYSYDIITALKALKALNRRGIKNIEFIIMGDGPLENKFKKYADKEHLNVNFMGKLEYSKMVTQLCNCDIAINPIIPGASQSIINKVGDYAAAGIPVINTQDCDEYKALIERYKCGINCRNNDPIEIADHIEFLINNIEITKKMGQNNRKMAEELFDREKNYNQILKIVEKMI